MKNKTYSKDIANAISRFLTEDDWHFLFDEQRGMFKFGLSLKSRMKTINYLIDVKDDEYVVYAVSPIGADRKDEKMMASMADFFCRANYGLKNGNFELDMRDGEIRYKSYVDCEGITPTTDIVRNSIHCPGAMFNQYGDGIVDIIFGGASAKDAIAKCEKSPEEQLRDLIGGDEELDAMITRLAAQLGIGGGEPHSDEGADTSDASADEAPEVKTDLFGTEGGAA